MKRPIHAPGVSETQTSASEATGNDSGKVDSDLRPQLTRIEPVPSPTPGQVGIQLTWSTGQQVTLAAVDLRFECPCAACVDEHTGIRTLRRESIPSDVRATRVEPVGRYALAFTWSDGHSTGMYSYDALWKLCERRLTPPT